MTRTRYDPQEIEPRWQAVWAKERTWEVQRRAPRGREDAGEASAAATSYVLEMLPYPSGEPHIGHLKVYSVGDAIAHFHRRTGARVLHPMGYDAFGLPAENHAIKTGVHPRDLDGRVDRLLPARVPLAGASRSTGRASSATHEPRYYRWTQWIFLKLFGPASPTARRRRSSGARTTRRCSPTSR